ncbi:MAG: 23S rRNA (adenine(2503)-C(2))-methyltransferase RlmN, partial [Clostridiales bacterium]|nr:23S rRNA (adenine(2503)-C(2))-methyltransferase RlmN [Clostridiales bacterium]
ERDLRASPRAQVARFLDRLTQLKISATVRRQLGDDIFGACGQLRAQRLKTPLQEEKNP